MRGQKIYQALVLSALMALLMAGCNPDSGSALLEVVYPSGYTKRAFVKGNFTNIEAAEKVV